ncbi:MAG: right-handed parallel beta-helix repeat-containing protein [Candidatus Hodarchaeales archaeon]|jgi:parallel beta-helix repeat protein
MKSNNKPIVLLTLFIAISLSFIINTQFWRDLIKYDNENYDRIIDDKEIGLKSAAYFPLTSRIHIDDLDPNLNWSKTAENDWCNGTGTRVDPYVIEDVVINGQERDSCILIENSNTVFFEIRNCTFYNSGDEYLYNEEAGIKLFNTSNGFFTNNNCSRNNINGIFLHESSNNTFSANYINRNDNNGIVFQDNCINNTVIGNEINYNLYNGLTLDWGSELNNVSQNDVNNNFQSGILLMGGTNNTISENILDRNRDYGILINDIQFTNITKNKLTKCGIGIDAIMMMDPFSNQIGTNNEVNGRSFYFYYNTTSLNNDNFTSAGPPGQIILISCNDSIISSNFNLSQTSIGISLFDCENNSISNINANDCNLAGIQLRFSDKNNITDNSVKSNLFGIELRTCNDTIVNHNNATNNNRGIQVEESYFTLLNNNNASYNLDSGISLANSAYNNITGNLACNNQEAGIRLTGSSGFNLISNNTINNNIHLFQYSYGIGIWVQDSENYNLTITKNILSNNSYAGILLYGENHTLSGNNFTNCGLHFTYSMYNPSIEEFNSHNIDVTNKVNGKTLYYYKNDINLNSNDFLDAGQIVLVNCNNSQILNMNINHTTVAVSQYYCRNNSISNNNFTYNAHSGILLVKCYNFIILNNNLSKNLNFYADESTYFGFGYGISIQDCYNVTSSFNNVSSNGMGIAITDSYDNQINNNFLYDNHMAGIIIIPMFGSCDNNNFSAN